MLPGGQPDEGSTARPAPGVSRTTVSNADHRPDQLSPEPRERVLARPCRPRGDGQLNVIRATLRNHPWPPRLRHVRPTWRDVHAKAPMRMDRP